MQEVIAVIITYNNYWGLKKLVENLLSQTKPPDEIVIVDNASKDETEKIKSNFPFITYIKLNENIGSAGGYYVGLETALDKKSKFIFTTDDDILYSRDVLENLVKTFYFLEKDKKNIATVRCVDEWYKYDFPMRFTTAPWHGTLFSTEAIKKIGLPNPKYFIYGEDLEYSLRLAKNGYTFWGSPQSRFLKKREGHKLDRKFFFMRATPYLQPFRLYYAFRNEMYIYLKYKRYLTVLILVLYALKVILFLRRINITIAIFDGLRDGILGKLGKNSKYPP